MPILQVFLDIFLIGILLEDVYELDFLPNVPCSKQSYAKVYETVVQYLSEFPVAYLDYGSQPLDANSIQASLSFGPFLFTSTLFNKLKLSGRFSMVNSLPNYYFNRSDCHTNNLIKHV
jgi:hypothetical protein